MSAAEPTVAVPVAVLHELLGLADVLAVLTIADDRAAYLETATELRMVVQDRAAALLRDAAAVTDAVSTMVDTTPPTSERQARPERDQLAARLQLEQGAVRAASVAGGVFLAGLDARHLAERAEWLLDRPGATPGGRHLAERVLAVLDSAGVEQLVVAVEGQAADEPAPDEPDVLVLDIAPDPGEPRGDEPVPAFPAVPGDVPREATVDRLVDAYHLHLFAQVIRPPAGAPPLSDDQRARHGLAAIVLGAAVAGTFLGERWALVHRTLSAGATVDQVAAALDLQPGEVRAGLRSWAADELAAGLLDDAGHDAVVALLDGEGS